MALGSGIVVIVGENGAGKTNLLESLHLATQGFSPRTRLDAQLIRFGASSAAVSVSLRHAGVAHQVELRVGAAGKSAVLDGARLPAADALRRELPTLIFTPDRLSVVKGGPAVRRAYFDRVLTRMHPARAALPGDYAAAVAQRNAALRRVQVGHSDRQALAPWTARVAELGALLVESRAETVEALAPGFATLLAELGLPGAALAYPSQPLTEAALEQRLAADIATGVTGIGPHRDDVEITAAGHDVRSFGSQGQQRLTLLALLLAEARLARHSPLLLLDDVLSELDAQRRSLLAERVAELEQTLITTTDVSALPVEPSQVVRVGDGQAR